jgi:hypothetical protein
MVVHDAERRPHWTRHALIVALLLAGGGAAVTFTRPGAETLRGLRDALEYVAGVFALLALTETVLSGVAAAERLVPVRFRLLVQSTHRATTVVAVGFLAAHVLLKITEAHASALDAFLPFAGHHRRHLYVGLGTIAADLLVLVLVTGLIRARFAASRWPWAWRTVHVLAYALWPLAVVHGLLAGRAARPWVVAGYAAAGGVVLLAVLSRLPRLARERRRVPARVSAEHTRVPVPPPGEAPAGGRWPGERR